MYSRFILFSLILLSSIISSGQIKKVLFVGNSYTYANDLPLMLSKLAKSTGDSLYYDSSTGGGQTLQGHSASLATIGKIQQGIWDYVVLQEQSQRPSFPMSQVSVEVFPYAKILCDTIRYYNNCTSPLFFMTWGRQNGDQANCATWPPVCTYEGMDSLLKLRYRMMADSNKALVSPVGAVWHYIRDNYPVMNLYSSDGSHPSLLGSYVAACTFYTMVFNKSPLLISNDYGLSDTDAVNIRNATQLIVYDSLSKWNVGKFSPVSDFAVWGIMDSISTTNYSRYADTYLWDFGDGATSTLFEPGHQYNSEGTYTVSLEASKCGVKIISDTTFYLHHESIDYSKKINFSVAPNPVGEFFIIKSKKIINATNVCLYNLEGRKVKSYSSFSSSEISFDVVDLPKGVYFLSIVVNSELIRIKIIK